MSSINNHKTPTINRGVELILRGKTPKKKTFSLCFDKVIFFFNREIAIHFNFSLNIGKPK